MLEIDKQAAAERIRLESAPSNQEEGRTFDDFVNWAASMAAHRYLKSRTLVDLCTIPREMVVQGRMCHYDGMDKTDLLEELLEGHRLGVEGVERMTLEELWPDFQMYILGSYEGSVKEAAGEFIRDHLDTLLPIVYGQAGVGKSAPISTDTRLD